MFDNTEYLTYRSKIEILVQAFPEVFHKKLPRPLKIGVHNDLNELVDQHGLTSDEVDVCLRIWTQRREYVQQACQVQHRFDLSGNKVCLIDYDNLRGFANRLAFMYAKLNRNFIGAMITVKKDQCNE